MARLVFAQTVVLAAICGILRWQRFRLLAERQGSRQTLNVAIGGGHDLHATQFGVRHLLIWTTSLALMLAGARALQILTPAAHSYRNSHWSLLSAGIGVAIVMVVALWAALGRGRSWLRWLVLAAAIVLCGILLVVGDGVTSDGLDYLWDLRQGWSTGYYWEHFFRYDAWLLAWVALAGGLLFATLLMPRALGYRLARPTRPAQ
jgi:hypothetical protein